MDTFAPAGGSCRGTVKREDSGQMILPRLYPIQEAAMSETRELYRANQGVSPETLSKIILKGDWKDLTPAQRVEGYIALCRALGLNPLTKPFDLLEMRDRTTLYLNSAGGAQLGAIHKASYTITRVETERLADTAMLVRAYVKVRLPDGRENEDVGIKACNPKDVNDYIRAYKSAITNARLRAIKGLIGLNVPVEGDEEEIPEARVVSVEIPAQAAEPEPTQTETAQAQTEPTPEAQQGNGHRPRVSELPREFVNAELRRLAYELHQMNDLQFHEYLQTNYRVDTVEQLGDNTARALLNAWAREARQRRRPATAANG